MRTARFQAAAQVVDCGLPNTPKLTSWTPTPAPPPVPATQWKKEPPKLGQKGSDCYPVAPPQFKNLENEVAAETLNPDENREVPHVVVDLNELNMLKEEDTRRRVGAVCRILAPGPEGIEVRKISPWTTTMQCEHC